jgi:hypothetical protein
VPSGSRVGLNSITAMLSFLGKNGCSVRVVISVIDSFYSYSISLAPVSMIFG